MVLKVKMLIFWLVGVLVCAALQTVRGDAEVMSHVTAHFGKALEECRQEEKCFVPAVGLGIFRKLINQMMKLSAGLPVEVMDDFKHFWRDDFEVVHRELGCAIICMSNKLDLLKDDTRIHHDNMDDYVKSFPQGEILSQKMVSMIHNCEKQYDDITDDCDRVVKTAACFKRDAKKEGIAPELAMIEAVIEKY